MKQTRFAFAISLVSAVAAFGACSSSDDTAVITCGAGTELSGSTCVPSATVDSGEVSDSDATTDTPITELTFGGVTSVSPAGSDRLLVTWAPGADPTTPSDHLTYDVFVATKSGDQNYAAATVKAPAGATSILLTDLAAGTYFIVVRARNAAGKTDSNTVEKSATPAADSTAPTFAGAKAAEPADGARVKLTWDAATDDLSAAGGISYLVYFAVEAGKETFAVPFAVSAPGATSMVTPPLPATKTPYFFIVRARDAAGNVDANKTEVTSESGTDTKAPVFSGCTAAITKDAGGISVFWDNATDDVTPAAAMRYRVYGAAKASDIDFSKPALATFTGGNTGVVTGLLPGTQYYLVCRAVDASSNEDDNKTVVTDKTALDSVAPTFAGLVSVTNVTATSADLTWAEASDDKTPTPEIEYWIYESLTTPVDTTGMPKYKAKGVSTYKVTSLVPATKLYWRVRAADAAGNQDGNVVEKFATTNVSFTLSIQPIFTASCAVSSCHATLSPAASMNLEDGKAHGNIVGVTSSENPAFMRIKAGDSTNSFLYRKITGTQVCSAAWTATCLTMPLPTSGAEALTDPQKNLIKTWIDQGAADD